MCLVCGKPIEPRKGGRPQKYCSAKCRNVGKARDFRKTNPKYNQRYRKEAKGFSDKPCRKCGKLFTPLRNNHVYCSNACAVSALLESKKYLATCRECGARFSQEIKNQRYCSKCKTNQRLIRTANNELKARLYKETKECIICNQKFTAYRSTSIYCSKVCAGVSRRARVKDGATLKVREVSCVYCKKTFMQKHPHQKFCSSSCSQMNWHYTERGQDKRFWTSYRLRYETVEKVLKAQDNACAICKTPFTGSNRLAIHVDHDHTCCKTVPTCGKCNRGLVCRNCNTILGMARDSADVLENAAHYLRTAKLPSPLD